MWAISSRRLVHQMHRVQVHCNVTDKTMKTEDADLVKLGIKIGGYRTCDWCFGPADTVEEMLELVENGIKVDDLRQV